MMQATGTIQFPNPPIIGWHEGEKDHDQAVACHNNIVSVRICENLQPWVLQFHSNQN